MTENETITLKEYIDLVIDNHERAQIDALINAEKNLERRLEALNDLRCAVERDRDMFVKREIYDTKTAFYDQWCRGIDEFKTKVETRYEGRLTAATWIAIVSIILSVVSIILNEACVMGP